MAEEKATKRSKEIGIKITNFVLEKVIFPVGGKWEFEATKDGLVVTNLAGKACQFQHDLTRSRFIGL